MGGPHFRRLTGLCDHSGSAEAGGSLFIAVFLWDSDGILIEARIDQLGPADQMDFEKFEQRFSKWVQELGEICLTPIQVTPFRVERFGVQFDFIYSRDQEEDEISEWIELHPGNYMAFSPPWDGRYDTGVRPPSGIC